MKQIEITVCRQYWHHLQLFSFFISEAYRLWRGFNPWPSRRYYTWFPVVQARNKQLDLEQRDAERMAAEILKQQEATLKVLAHSRTPW